MSLINLMRFARSLRSGKDEVRTFQPAQGNLVPVFTRSGSRPDPVFEEPGRTGRARSAGADSPAGESRQEEMPLGGGRAATKSRSGRWLSRPSGPRPSLKADAKGQLSLEFVRVVRNDLSDADLELVPARPSAAPSPRPASPSPFRSVTPAPAGGQDHGKGGPGVAVALAAAAGAEGESGLEPETSRWSRFRARLFGVGTPG